MNDLKPQLNDLYRQIQACRVCPNMDDFKCLRRQEAIYPSTDVFIISQALAEGQLRKSGVNFFTDTGQLGQTGQNLEKFLNKFQRTVYPPRNIRLNSGVTIRKSADDFISVYNTEIAQCFPGKPNKNTKGDRPPSAKEITTCLSKGFMEREIFLIKPKLLLLMGDKSRRSFFKYVLKEPRKDNLGEHLGSIIISGEIPKCKVRETPISVLPIQHASGANPSFHSMLANKSLIRIIRGCLALDK